MYRLEQGAKRKHPMFEFIVSGWLSPRKRFYDKTYLIAHQLFEYKAISPMHENSVRSGTRALILNHVRTLFEMLH